MARFFMLRGKAQVCDEIIIYYFFVFQGKNIRPTKKF